MGSLETRSDLELLRASVGDPDAFGTFYRRHVKAVLSFVSGRVAGHEAADVVSEVFAAALVYRRRFDPARGPADAWLVGIARNKIADAKRRGFVEAKLYSRLGAQPVRGWEDPEIDQSGLLLEGLPEDQRRAVIAHIVDERPHAEVAGQEDVSPQVVRQRVSRALRSLRARFQEEQR